MKFIRFIVGALIAAILINIGGSVADYFEFTRTTCIFGGGVAYVIHSIIGDMIDAAHTTSQRVEK